jgi:hypothetical protein
LRSYHLDRSAGFNENNRGFGAEYDVNPNTKIAGGHFQNSVNHDSRYLGAALMGQPFDSVPGLKMGGLLGLIDGYPLVNKGGVFPMAAPMASYEGKNFGVNVLALPKVGNISPVVAAMLKARFK